MKRHIALASLILLVICSAFGAVTDIHTDSFFLEFQKPPFNEFFFSDPQAVNNPYNMASGVAFPTAKESESAKGYPSQQYLGITYKLESKGVLEVFCNANLDNTSNHRMISSGTLAVGLDYKIDVFADYAQATSPSGTVLATIAADADAKASVYTKRIESPMTARESRVFKFVLTSPMDIHGNYVPYTEGQYKGYVIMQFTPTV